MSSIRPTAPSSSSSLRNSTLPTAPTSVSLLVSNNYELFNNSSPTTITLEERAGVNNEDVMNKGLTLRGSFNENGHLHGRGMKINNHSGAITAGTYSHDKICGHGINIYPDNHVLVFHQEPGNRKVLFKTDIYDNIIATDEQGYDTGAIEESDDFKKQIIAFLILAFKFPELNLNPEFLIDTLKNVDSPNKTQALNGIIHNANQRITKCIDPHLYPDLNNIVQSYITYPDAITPETPLEVIQIILQNALEILTPQ